MRLVVVPRQAAITLIRRINSLSSDTVRGSEIAVRVDDVICSCSGSCDTSEVEVSLEARSGWSDGRDVVASRIA